MAAKTLGVLDVARGSLVEPLQAAVDGGAHRVGVRGASRRGDEKQCQADRNRAHDHILRAAAARGVVGTRSWVLGTRYSVLSSPPASKARTPRHSFARGKAIFPRSRTASCGPCRRNSSLSPSPSRT